MALVWARIGGAVTKAAAPARKARRVGRIVGRVIIMSFSFIKGRQEDGRGFAPRPSRLSRHCAVEEALQPVERDHVDPVIKVDMARAGHDQQFAVFGDLLMHGFAEIQAVRLIA